jgi:alkylated DNA nucleotide flippase Atl1
MEEELNSIEADLRNSPGEWQWHVAQMIATIPSGQLATYGAIAAAVNHIHGHSINARNVAWLRGKLYELLTHDTAVPLHRVAKAGDIESLYDSQETKSINDELRRREGSLHNPIWWEN